MPDVGILSSSMLETEGSSVKKDLGTVGKKELAVKRPSPSFSSSTWSSLSPSVAEQTTHSWAMLAGSESGVT